MFSRIGVFGKCPVDILNLSSRTESYPLVQPFPARFCALAAIQIHRYQNESGFASPLVCMVIE